MTVALLVGALLSLAGGAVWALWERIGRKELEADVAELRGHVESWKGRFERASADAEKLADDLRAERERAAGDVLSVTSALRTARFDLEVCRAEIPRLVQSLPPADAARAAGDLLERSLQRAREAIADRVPTPPRGVVPALRPAADTGPRDRAGQ